MNPAERSAAQSDRCSHSILEIVEVETGDRTVLREFDTVVEAPNWTGDGRNLVFNSGGLIYAYEFGTGEVRQINTGFARACNNDHVPSPDGKRLAVSCASAKDRRSRIYTLPIGGGTPALVTPEGPSYLHGWSPDGKTLAYCAERNGQFDIYSIPAGGGEEKKLTDLPGLDDGPEYSPDGKYIWFNSTRSGLMQVWRMQTDGADPVQMTFEDANCWFPHVSPDGRLAAFLVYRKADLAPDEHLPDKQVEIRLMPAEGGRNRVIARLFGGQGTINVNSWSPDGKKLAFVSYRENQDGGKI